MELIRPFVKWAGGKGGLIPQLKNFYPFDLENGIIERYVEPFIGGGAVLIDILQKYDVKEAYAFDINKDLINCYNVIKSNVEDLIEELDKKEKEFLKLETDDRTAYFYDIRNKYNSYKLEKVIDVKRASEFIFLNRTCFNGLYRVNRKGLFNVPMGNYKNPCICDSDNLKNVSNKLQKVKIVCGDYREAKNFIDENTFVYFDPPYRPLNDTSSFTAYTENLFSDESQIELAKFVSELDEKGAKIVVSNSDPKNINEDDDFFDEIYSNQIIKRVDATRMINSKASARGKIKELLISNFEIL